LRAPRFQIKKREVNGFLLSIAAALSPPARLLSPNWTCSVDIGNMLARASARPCVQPAGAFA
jgi:hypothetical protein